MATSTLVSTLVVKSKLLAGLDHTALQQIRLAAQVRCMPPNKGVVVTGGRPDHLFLVQAGRARSFIHTESGSEINLFWKGPGDVIGLVSLLANPPNYMANASTVTECEFLVWEHRVIRRLAKAYPQLAENGFSLAVSYIGEYMKRHANLLTKGRAARLAQTLLHLAADAGVVQPSGIVIDITNEQLSSLSDVSSFTASRLLSRWQREGMLVKRRGSVTLLAPESLECKSLQ
jgi:CRP/FNR family transcriptional regulator, nitrogen oxide reductase regulator